MQRPPAILDRRARHPGGRPRVLTLEKILDAALKMGLAGISMSALAAELGTSAATLYNYVANRDDLLRRAVAHATAGRPALDDLGQNTRELMRSHARNLRYFWGSEPQMFEQYLAGFIGPDLLMDYTDSVLSALERRGFDVQSAYRMLTAINTFVLGTIARDLYLASLHHAGTSHSEAARQAMAMRDPARLTHLRQVSDYRRDETVFDFVGMIDRIIESFANEQVQGDGVPG
jgi:AcrR family transcriptional regulator